MKILHVISSGGMYGAEAVILDLARGLSDRGHTSMLGVFTSVPNEETEFRRRAKAAGLETHEILCRRQLDRTVPSQIRDLARRTGADVVHAHGYKGDVYTYWALRGAGVPLVSTCHTWYDNDLALRLYGILDRLVLRRFAAVVAVSREVRERLMSAGVSSARIHTVRNGISSVGFAGTADATLPETGIATTAQAPLTVGLVGRLAPEKGVDVFLRAATLVHAQLPETRFVVAGDGPDRAALEALRSNLALNDSAVLLGRQENMPAFFASLDLLVSASRQEGLPIALLEAMASGLPVVATSVGEVPEVVQPSITGLLVKPEDPAALAEAILQLLRDPAARQRMGINSRARIKEQFSAQRMTSDYLKIYQGLVRGGGQ